MSAPSYVNLHTHSDYSLLDGLAKVEQLVARTKELGMPALGLTDHGVLYGAIDFYKTCKKAEIKPIIGVEAYLAPRSRFDKVTKIDSKYFHLTLLARNLTGYQNLIELVTAGWLEGFYYKPRIDRELLAKKADGLVILTGCGNGEVARAILDGKLDEAEQTIRFYQELVGPDHVFLEIQDHPKLAEQGQINTALKALAKKHQWPLVATCDSHYVHLKDKEAHEVLLAVQSKSMDEDKRWSLKEVDLHLRTPEEMTGVFADVPEALTNTLKIAELCQLEIKFGDDQLPEFPSLRGLSNQEELHVLCAEGLKRRYPDGAGPMIEERVAYELSVINRMGFASYFLIVADYITWARANRILVGPGRGSAAGSMVAYLLGITELDPIKYNLLFERFLNPDRISMPDIDTDFADVDRAKVINYVRTKYGDDHVAGIITFGTMASRAAIRDTGRAIGMTYQEVDRIAKLVPPPKQGMHSTIANHITDVPELKKIYEEEAAAKQLLDLAGQLEGTFRHAGQHASAIVISRDPLTKTVPLQPAQKGDVAHVTQFSMYPIDELGLLKMDFLGLSNLSIIHRAVEIIEALEGNQIDVDTIPFDDPQTFALLSRGDTTGVFQLESAGMKRYLKELKPTEFDDIIAMVALYRPGPMQFIDNYIRRKHDQEPVTYRHPLLENALKSTYGIMLYQEQVMQLAKEMCGFTGGQADTLRKAIGKKIPKLMKEQRQLFVDGAVKNGVDRQLAEDIFTQIEEFALYSFNRAHSACYGYIAYQTAYLKAHYPSAFMAALMTTDHDDIDRLAIEIEECRRMGIEVLPPDVNESFVDFGVVKETGNIRFGLAGIKNIGEGVAQAIVRQRKAHGPYHSLLNFVDQLGSEVINKKALESLAKAGALDAFAERNQILQALDQILKIATASKKAAESQQIGLFDVGGPVALVEPTLELPAVPPSDKRQKLAWEKELLGMFLSDHPLREVEELIHAYATPISSLKSETIGQRVRVAGIILNLKKILTKDKSTMVFGTLEDVTSSLEIILFPRTLEQYQELAHPDALVLIEGRVSSRDSDLKIVVEKMWPLGEQLELEELPPFKSESRSTNHESRKNYDRNSNFRIRNSASGARYALVITLPPHATKDLLGKIKATIERYPGEAPVYLRMPDNGGWKEVVTKSRVDLSQSIEVELGHLVGKSQISLAEQPIK